MFLTDMTPRMLYAVEISITNKVIRHWQKRGKTIRTADDRRTHDELKKFCLRFPISRLQNQMCQWSLKRAVLRHAYETNLFNNVSAKMDEVACGRMWVDYVGRKKFVQEESSYNLRQCPLVSSD